MRAHLFNIADKTKRRITCCDLQCAPVLTRETNSDIAVHIDCTDNLWVDVAIQHHLHNLHGRLVCHAKTINELRLNVQPRQHVVDLRATTMNHDRTNAHRVHQNNVFSKQSKSIMFRSAGQRVTAVLHNNSASRKPPNVRKRLNENVSTR